MEYEGLIPRIEALAKLIDENDLVIVESRDSGSDVHVLATASGAELLGTALLLATVIGSGIMGERLAGGAAVVLAPFLVQ